MGNMKTPGVYIVEKNAFPNSVVEVATAVPAFIGYTEKAANGSQDLLNKPFRITSMSEFEKYFGGAKRLKFTCTTSTDSGVNLYFKGVDKSGKEEITGYKVGLATGEVNFSLYYHMLLYFANGGGPCYIVSVGLYVNNTKIDAVTLQKGIQYLEAEREPTMLVIPEASGTSSYQDIYTAMLAHCGAVMKNRIALFDVPGTAEEFREGIGSEYLSYGAAYYPFLNTTLLSEKDVTYLNLKDEDGGILNTIIESLKVSKPSVNASDTDQLSFHNLLYNNSPLYKAVMTEIRRQINQLSPVAAIAGIYCRVDDSRGVWKAPANVSVNNVVSVSEMITNEMQEDLNVPLNGKSINAIRYFTGDGIKVWGARTLDGNSLDWRYINVRRTMIFLEESIRNAALAYVFEPNVASTWLNMKSMIENFLMGVWKRGGLAGASPEDAYSVHVGLGDTMTPEDILEGILKITVLVAVSHPAEFIEITFQQQMQKS